MLHRITPRTRNALVFSSALILLLLGAGVAYITISGLLDAERWVAHTRQVQSALSNIANVISRAGRSRIEYVQSGDSSRLEVYRGAVNDTRAIVVFVRQMTADNRQQQKNCDQLESLLQQRIDLMDKSIELKRTGGATLQNEGDLTQAIVGVGVEMDLLTRQMQDVEDHLLADRQARSRILFVRAVEVFGITFILSVFLLGLHYYFLNKELRAREKAESSFRHLNARLLEMQDAERRKISRELHDSLGQYLSGAKMSLEILAQSIAPNPRLTESIAILDKSIAETRTISHLLHPPLLDEVGFASAAKWYVEGFSQRSGIPVSLTLPNRMTRLSSAVELALFRVLQECLTNIHRHSESQQAQVSVSLLPGEVQLRVSDEGRGMTPAMVEKFQTNSGYLGIGLAGMRERLRELGGRMEVDSDDTGTRIVATLPTHGSIVESP